MQCFKQHFSIVQVSYIALLDTRCAFVCGCFATQMGRKAEFVQGLKGLDTVSLDAVSVSAEC